MKRHLYLDFYVYVEKNDFWGPNPKQVILNLTSIAKINKQFHRFIECISNNNRIFRGEIYLIH